MLELHERRARSDLLETGAHPPQPRARKPREVLARASDQARLGFGQDLDDPAPVAQPLRGALGAGVRGQHVRDQTRALHRLEQPQRAFLATRHRRLGQERRDHHGGLGRAQAAHAANMAAVRILVCASEAPRPPLNGSRLVLRELCERLAARHEITVLALRHPDQSGPPPAGVTMLELPFSPPGPVRAWAQRAIALALNEPVEVRRLARPFQRALPGLVASFDAAHVMLGNLAGIAPALDGLPAVIAPLDAWDRNVAAEAAVARGPEILWRRSQERAVRRWQARAYRPFARVVLVTEADAREVARLDPSLRTAAIPNGVDAAHFAPGRHAPGTAFCSRARWMRPRTNARRCGSPSGCCRACAPPCRRLS